jgi:hypothetical protein
MDVHDQPPVERHHESHSGFIDVETADGVAGTALEDAHNPPLGATICDALDAGDDAIAMHRLIQIAAGDVDVAGNLFQRPVRDDKAETSWIGRDAAHDEVHSIRQAVPVAAGLHQLAVGHQLPEQPLEGRPLLSWKLEPLEQLARRRGVVDLFPNQLEQLFLVQHK